MAAGLGRAVLAFGGGQIIITLGYRSLFLTGAGLFFAAVLFFWGYFGRRAREQPVRPEAAV
jgi:predicted MFS family arabinose efflux permease